MMRNLAATILVLSFALRLAAQLPQGSSAPDFTATDINGDSWNLYSLLDSGKIVIIEISATWCPPCWAYHNSHAMQDFYEDHGPQGDNTARVLFIEGDPTTNLNCLFGNAGCNSNSPGNWTAGVHYPIFDNAAIADLYEIEYYPTVFAVCPNKKVYEIGQLNAEALWDAARECPVASGVNNAGIFHYDKGTPLHEICDTVALNTNFTLVNLGSTPLTTAQVELRWNNNLVDTVHWNGYLTTYGETQIAFDPFAVFQPGNLKTTVSYINYGADDDLTNNNKTDQFVLAENFNAQKVLLKIRTDQYGAETYWELRDESGNVLDHGGNTNVGPNGGGMFPAGISNGPGAYGNNIVVKDTLELPAGGCYSIRFVDAYGDGMCCDFGNGYYRMYNLDNLLEPIVTGGEFKAYDNRAFGVPGMATTAQEFENSHPLRIFPNPAKDALQFDFYLEEPSDVRIEITSATGQPVFTDNFHSINAGNGSYSVPVQSLPQGLYLLQLIAGNRRLSGKFAIVR